jgi:hypothetical protein
MTRRKIENKITELEQQDSDDELTLCLLTRHGNAHDESKSVEDADITIQVRESLYELWDVDVSDGEDVDPWARDAITGEVIE